MFNKLNPFDSKPSYFSGGKDLTQDFKVLLERLKKSQAPNDIKYQDNLQTARYVDNDNLLESQNVNETTNLKNTVKEALQAKNPMGMSISLRFALYYEYIKVCVSSDENLPMLPKDVVGKLTLPQKLALQDILASKNILASQKLYFLPVGNVELGENELTEFLEKKTTTREHVVSVFVACLKRENNVNPNLLSLLVGKTTEYLDANPDKARAFCFSLSDSNFKTARDVLFKHIDRMSGEHAAEFLDTYQKNSSGSIDNGIILALLDKASGHLTQQAAYAKTLLSEYLQTKNLSRTIVGKYLSVVTPEDAAELLGMYQAKDDINYEIVPLLLTKASEYLKQQQWYAKALFSQCLERNLVVKIVKQYLSIVTPKHVVEILKTLAEESVPALILVEATSEYLQTCPDKVKEFWVLCHF